jgi:transcription elongation factor Elf1
MKIKKVKLQPYEEHLICEKCGCEMKVPPRDPNSYEIALLIIGPKIYTHVCENCGNTETTVDVQYPRTVWEECKE